MFSGIHDLYNRDTRRDWSKSTVKTEHFDVAVQGAPSYQNPWELAQMVEVFCERQPMTILELGPYHGGTLYHFIKNALPGAMIGAVDYFDELLGPRAATPEDWVKWLPHQNMGFKFFEGNTHDPEIIRQVTDYFSQGLDWLFIDATHDYEDCKVDFQNYGKLVRPGGIIGIHDIRPRNMGTYKLWEEIRDAGYVTKQIVADPISTEVDAGIGLVYL
jgi:cephalosporin hydroxylase